MILTFCPNCTTQLSDTYSSVFAKNGMLFVCCFSCGTYIPVSISDTGRIVYNTGDACDKR